MNKENIDYDNIVRLINYNIVRLINDNFIKANEDISKSIYDNCKIITRKTKLTFRDALLYSLN